MSWLIGREESLKEGSVSEEVKVREANAVFLNHILSKCDQMLKHHLKGYHAEIVETALYLIHLLKPSISEETYNQVMSKYRMYWETEDMIQQHKIASEMYYIVLTAVGEVSTQLTVKMREFKVKEKVITK